MPDIATGCHDFEADLSALLDGELATPRAAEVRAHVASCDGCRGRLARLARVDAALAGAPAPAVPASLRARLDARLASARETDTPARRTRQTEAPRRAWLGPAGGALAAAAAGVALYLAVATREPERQESAHSPAPGIAPEVESAEDLEVIANLELLELVLAAEAG